MRVTSVKYLKDYQIEVSFHNRVVKRFDLKEFLFSEYNPMITKYRKIELFKKVYEERGFVYWNDGELSFGGDSLYNWDIAITVTKKELQFHH